MTNGFALNHGKGLQIYFFCLKRRAKNDFLKDVESTVVEKCLTQSDDFEIYISHRCVNPCHAE